MSHANDSKKVKKDANGNTIILVQDRDWLYNILWPIVGTFEAGRLTDRLLFMAFTRETLEMSLEFQVYDAPRVATIIRAFFD